MKPPRFPWRIYVIILVVLVLFALGPVLSVFFTYAVAEANGCTVTEASVHPCLVFGADWGEFLYFTGVVGWLALATLPLGGGAIIVWLVVLLIHYVAWRQKVRMP